MTSRLLPLLLCAAAFLAGCHKDPPPPPSLRFHVTASGILDQTTNRILDPSTLADWLSTEITHHRINPDVRVDFDTAVPVWRLDEIINHLLSAGAQAPPHCFGFNIAGSTGGDFLLSWHGCGYGPETPATDEWGDYVTTTIDDEPYVQCEARLEDGTLCPGGNILSLDDLREMLLARRRAGTVWLTIASDQLTTAAGLVPVLQITRHCGALFSLSTESPWNTPPIHRQRPHPATSPRSLRIPKPPLDAFLHTVTILSWDRPPSWLWLPAQFKMLAPSGGEGSGY